MASSYSDADDAGQQPPYPPLTETEREQLRAHGNVDLRLAWVLIKNIVLHPEVSEQIRIKSIEVNFLNSSPIYSKNYLNTHDKTYKKYFPYLQRTTNSTHIF